VCRFRRIASNAVGAAAIRPNWRFDHPKRCYDPAQEGLSMRCAGLLLLVLVFAVPLIAAGPTEQPTVPANWSSEGANAFVFSQQAADSMFTMFPPEQFGQDAIDSSDSICYKIRAYIFKQDDGHAPEFKGSTTCQPRQARAKDIAWPTARLVPAN
jgi:hypothetical protein